MGGEEECLWKGVYLWEIDVFLEEGVKRGEEERGEERDVCFYEEVVCVGGGECVCVCVKGGLCVEVCGREEGCVCRSWCVCRWWYVCGREGGEAREGGRCLSVVVGGGEKGCGGERRRCVCGRG